MAKHNAVNERIKREYLAYLKEAKGRDEATIDRVAASLARFEDSTGRRDFKRFHHEQAVAFKRRLGETINAKTGQPRSKATIHSTLRDLKAFFFWLAHLPGFKKQIAYDDCEYFNLSDKDVAIARASREKAVPSLEQVAAVLAALPAVTVLERRDRALVAFTAITGARVGALASFRLSHVDLDGGFVDQDARTVNTKFAKSFRTYFMPVIDGAEGVVRGWVDELRRQHLRGPADPLFPATMMGLGQNGGFEPQGLKRHGWASTGPVREVFKRAFECAGLPYHNPHSIRDMLVRYGEKYCRTPEEFKAWSQNLGHTHVLTTFTSYGYVPVHRQGELIRGVGASQGNAPLPADIIELARRIAKHAG